MRRLFVIVSGVVLLPVMAVIAGLIALTSGLPIIFPQRRIGKDGVPFTMYKFRTMVSGAERLRASVARYNEARGPVFKMKDDPRFTRLGKFLSHTGLDELPQLLNIYRGEMWFIGPRPLPVDEAKRLKPWMRKRERVLPGIISPWVFTGYHTTSFADWMRSDITYADQQSAVGDAILMARGCLLLVRLLVRETFRLLSR